MRVAWIFLMSSRVESEAIANVLKDSDSLNHNQFGYEESYACTGSQLIWNLGKLMNGE